MRGPFTETQYQSEAFAKQGFACSLECQEQINLLSGHPWDPLPFPNSVPTANHRSGPNPTNVRSSSRTAAGSTTR